MTKYAEQLAHVLRRWLGPERNIIIVGDSAFCCRNICRACIRRNITFCARFRLDASLFSEPPPHNGKRGRKRVVGERLPNLDKVAVDPNTKWETHSIIWYGGETHKVELVTGTCLWYHNSSGKPVPIRWVLSRTNGEVAPFLCTNQAYSSVEILECAVSRWSIETTFQEVRSHLGYESIYTWADKGIERVSPSIMASYSIICLIASRAMQDNNEKIKPQKCAWYDKPHVTFSDVYSYVKLLILKNNIFTHPSENTPMRKKLVYQLLYWAVAA